MLQARVLRPMLWIATLAMTVGVLGVRPAPAGAATAPTAPTATMLTPSSPVTLSTSVRVSWSGSASSGIDHYEVLVETVARDGSGYGAMWLANTTATSATYAGAPGNMYCFEVRAQDRAGNMSAWTRLRCTAVPLRSDQFTRSAGWTRATSSSYSGGFAYKTTTHNASAALRGIAAKRLYLVATKCASCGSVVVRWNGRVIATVSLHNPATAHGQVIKLATFPAVQSGVLSVTAASPTGKLVVLEGLAVGI